jgi:serine/threonine protein kinase
LPRPADKIFLKLAVQGGYLTRQDADDVWDELVRLEGEGEPTKARILCLEFGFMDKGLSRKIKHEVRAALEKMAREESRSQRRVAGFELIERISSGAMGTVYKARHLKLNKTVALKLLNPDMAADDSYVQRFVQEAQVAAAMNHPNVVQAYDVGQVGGVHFIAMEFIEGKTIKELIKRRGTVEESAAVELVLQVLDGLRHAWEHKLVHRDVKPANLMISRDGQAKLLDLGLVRRTDAACELTGEGKAIGTPYFMAPEQALDKGADYRADIYALGATLFNMVTGEKPYVAGTPVGVMQLHIKAQVPDASERNPRVSRGLSQVIEKMLAKRPSDRYQDPENLVGDLTQVLSGFMPDLRRGETPIGLDHIKPRGGGDTVVAPGRRRGGRRRDEDDEEGNDRSRGVNTGPPVHLLAAAAGVVVLLILAAVFLQGDPPPPPKATPTPELAKEDPQDTKERAAGKLFEELEASESWQRKEDLVALANRYPRTDAGRRARREADSLHTLLTNREERRFAEDSKRLTGLAQEGALLEAVEGFVAMAEELRTPDLKGQARRRADELGGVLEKQRSELDRKVAELTRTGNEREAAQARREKAALLPAKERATELAKAEAIEAKIRTREQAATDAATQDKALREAKEEASLASLPLTLVALIKESQLPAALEVATQTANEVEIKRFQERAQVHVEALVAIQKLDALALVAFAKREGETVSLKRRKGRKITGTLAGVEGKKVKIRLSSRAEISLGLEEIDEQAVWRRIALVHGARDKAYLRGVTSLKLYRSDTDALEFLRRCQEEELDLSPLVKELANTGEPVAKVEEPQPKDPTPAKPRKKTREEEVKEALEERSRIQALIKQRARVFQEASDVGYADDQLEPVYRFFRQGEGFGREWKLRKGRAIPTPPGQMERVGLRLEGRDGRVEFFAPLHKNVQVRVRFIAHSVSRNGRFAIVLDGDGKQRVSNELGQLEYRKRGRPKARTGQSQVLNLRSRGESVLEIIRDGNTFVAKLNNRETARLKLPEGKEFGDFKVSLEWARVNVNIIEIRTLCHPDPDWVKKRLKP